MVCVGETIRIYIGVLRPMCCTRCYTDVLRPMLHRCIVPDVATDVLCPMLHRCIAPDVTPMYCVRCYTDVLCPTCCTRCCARCVVPDVLRPIYACVCRGALPLFRHIAPTGRECNKTQSWGDPGCRSLRSLYPGLRYPCPYRAPRFQNLRIITGRWGS